jgi:hypothetical protein
LSAEGAGFVALAMPRPGPAAAPDPRRLHLVDLARESERGPPREPAPAARAEPTLRFDEADLARVCAVVSRRAVDDAERRAAELAAAAEVELQRALGAALATLAAESTHRLALAQRTACCLALAALRRCLSRPRPELDEEIEALVGRALAEIDGHTRLDVHLAPDDLDRLGARLPALASAAGFAGELHCDADPSLAAGSVRCRWGEAWAERDVGGWLRQLEEGIEAHRGTAVAPPNGPTTTESEE